MVNNFYQLQVFDTLYTADSRNIIPVYITSIIYFHLSERKHTGKNITALSTLTPVDHGERHADQLHLHPRVPQQLLGLDRTIQGDTAGKAGSPLSPGLSITGAHRSWPETTEELTPVHPRDPVQLRARQQREDLVLRPALAIRSAPYRSSP